MIESRNDFNFCLLILYIIFNARISCQSIGSPTTSLPLGATHTMSCTEKTLGIPFEIVLDGVELLRGSGGSYKTLWRFSYDTVFRPHTSVNWTFSENGLGEKGARVQQFTITATLHGYSESDEGPYHCGARGRIPGKPKRLKMIDLIETLETNTSSPDVNPKIRLRPDPNDFHGPRYLPGPSGYSSYLRYIINGAGIILGLAIAILTWKILRRSSCLNRRDDDEPEPQLQMPIKRVYSKATPSEVTTVVTQSTAGTLSLPDGALIVVLDDSYMPKSVRPADLKGSRPLDPITLAIINKIQATSSEAGSHVSSLATWISKGSKHTVSRKHTEALTAALKNEDSNRGPGVKKDIPLQTRGRPGAGIERDLAQNNGSAIQKNKDAENIDVFAKHKAEATANKSGPMLQRDGPALQKEARTARKDRVAGHRDKRAMHKDGPEIQDDAPGPKLEESEEKRGRLEAVQDWLEEMLDNTEGIKSWFSAKFGSKRADDSATKPEVLEQEVKVDHHGNMTRKENFATTKAGDKSKRDRAEALEAGTETKEMTRRSGLGAEGEVERDVGGKGGLASTKDGHTPKLEAKGPRQVAIKPQRDGLNSKEGKHEATRNEPDTRQSKGKATKGRQQTNIGGAEISGWNFGTAAQKDRSLAKKDAAEKKTGPAPSPQQPGSDAAKIGAGSKKTDGGQQGAPGLEKNVEDETKALRSKYNL